MASCLYGSFQSCVCRVYYVWFKQYIFPGMQQLLAGNELQSSKRYKALYETVVMGSIS